MFDFGPYTYEPAMDFGGGFAATGYETPPIYELSNQTMAPIDTYEGLWGQYSYQPSADFGGGFGANDFSGGSNGADLLNNANWWQDAGQSNVGGFGNLFGSILGQALNQQGQPQAPQQQGFNLGGLLSSLLGGGAGTGALLGGLAGLAQGNGDSTRTVQNKMDPRMDPYIYGDNGVLKAAQDWFQQNRNGNPLIKQGAQMQADYYSSPQYQQNYQRLSDLGMGLLGGGIAGNPFSQGKASL